MVARQSEAVKKTMWVAGDSGHLLKWYGSENARYFVLSSWSVQ
jgi:hypothetical protein